MKSMNVWLVGGLCVAVAGGGGYWIGHRRGVVAGASQAKPEEAPETPVEEVKPVPTVVVAPVRRSSISDPLIAYGTVVAPPNEVRVQSVPFEARVTRILVAPGQTVSGDQPLVEIEGSSATMLAAEEAHNAVAAAQKDVHLIEQRFEQQLATTAELQTAQNTLRGAQARLKSLQQAGADGPQTLKANAPGVVSKVDVQTGQVVPVGGPLVEVAARKQIEVKLGVEPGDVQHLKLDQPVQLHPVDSAGGAGIEGKVRLIGQRVDPTTRLVDVMVSLPTDATLLLETFVVGRTVLASADDALVVPRAAVAPGEETGQYVLFTVKDGKAAKHAVHVGVETDRDVQVLGDDVKEGDLVVLVGNYELEDGMEVRAQPAPTTPATTQRAEQSTPATTRGVSPQAAETEGRP